jgi:hypothetical protein
MVLIMKSLKKPTGHSQRAVGGLNAYAISGLIRQAMTKPATKELMTASADITKL